MVLLLGGVFWCVRLGVGDGDFGILEWNFAAAGGTDGGDVNLLNPAL